MSTSRIVRVFRGPAAHTLGGYMIRRGTRPEEATKLEDRLRKDLMIRVRRMEGQMRGIARMIEEDAYCIDVLTQLQAVSAACDATGLLLLDDHVRTCVTDAVRGGREEEKLEELSAAVRRFARR